MHQVARTLPQSQAFPATNVGRPPGCCCRTTSITCWTAAGITLTCRERLWQEKPYWIRRRELVLSYSGVARAQETQRVLHRELPGVEFVRTNRPTGRSGKCALLTRLLRGRGCTRVGHIDDRSDICEEITAGVLRRFVSTTRTSGLVFLCPRSLLGCGPCKTTREKKKCGCLNSRGVLGSPHPWHHGVFI